MRPAEGVAWKTEKMSQRSAEAGTMMSINICFGVVLNRLEDDQFTLNEGQPVRTDIITV
jgi:hypothetical protein